MGYSKFLLKKAINLMKRMKIKTINFIAINTYKNIGFKITEKNYEKNKLFGYTMSIQLW